MYKHCISMPTYVFVWINLPSTPYHVITKQNFSKKTKKKKEEKVKKKWNPNQNTSGKKSSGQESKKGHAE